MICKDQSNFIMRKSISRKKTSLQIQNRKEKYLIEKLKNNGKRAINYLTQLKIVCYSNVDLSDINLIHIIIIRYVVHKVHCFLEFKKLYFLPLKIIIFYGSRLV